MFAQPLTTCRGASAWLLRCALITMILLTVQVRPSRSEPHETLMVIGVEYSAWPDHHCVEGIHSSLEAFAFPDSPLSATEQRASDLAALVQNGPLPGSAPLWWPAHWNWQGGTGPEQLQDLVGIIDATPFFTPLGTTLAPDAIALLNLGVDPNWGGMGWRRQLAIEVANLYLAADRPAPAAAFMLELDWHRAPSVFYEPCGRPYTQLWVPAGWHELPAAAAWEAVAEAIRSRRVIGTVGEARFAALEIENQTLMTLDLTAATRRIQLWGGGEEPLAIWEETATATFDLAELPLDVHSIYWFAYGDSSGATWDWETETCRDKEVFFTSPIVRSTDTYENQYAADALAGLIPIKLLAHQHTHLSADGQNAPTFEELMVECRAFGIDCVMTADHVANPEGLQGALPSCVAVWDEVPMTTLAGSALCPPTPALRAYPNPLVAGGVLTIEGAAGPSGEGAAASPGEGVARWSETVIRLFDAQGRFVDRLQPMTGSGHHGRRHVLHLSRYPSGVYYVEVRSGASVSTVPVVSIR